jgi:hypothetical protein
MVRAHPGFKWKALNVCEQGGLDGPATADQTDEEGPFPGDRSGAPADGRVRARARHVRSPGGRILPGCPLSRRGKKTSGPAQLRFTKWGDQ